MRCHQGMKEFNQFIKESENIDSDLIINKEYDFTKLQNNNVRKLKRLYRSSMIRKIHICVFFFITLILCITAISLFGDRYYNLDYINDGYIIFGVAFGTLGVAIFFVIMTMLSYKKIYRITKGKYEILNELMKSNIVDANINKYSVGIQMGFSSSLLWSINSDIKWNPINIAVSIAALFDALANSKN